MKMEIMTTHVGTTKASTAIIKRSFFCPTFVSKKYQNPIAVFQSVNESKQKACGSNKWRNEQTVKISGTSGKVLSA